MFRLNLLERVGLQGVDVFCLVAAALVLVACDDEPRPLEPPTLRWVSPAADHSLLTCAVDTDHETLGILDYDVRVQVESRPGQYPLAGLVASLSLPGRGRFDPMIRPVPANGAVEFSAAPLPVGRGVDLRVELMAEGVVLAVLKTEVDVVIDVDDASCFAHPPPSIRFTHPTEGLVLSADEDLDGNLDNALQIDVHLEVADTHEARLELLLDGERVAESEVVDGEVVFEAVQLPTHQSDDFPIRLRARLHDGRQPLPLHEDLTVYVDIPACRLDIQPLPRAEACDLQSEDDLDPSTPELDIDLIAETDCGTVVFIVNAARQSQQIVVDNQARQRVVLRRGHNVISAIGTTRSGLTAVVEPYSLRVDHEAPSITLDVPADRRIGLGALRPSGNTIAFELIGAINEWLPSRRLDLTVDPPPIGEVPPVRVDEHGAFTVRFDIDAAACATGCPVTLVLSAVDACGNRRDEQFDLELEPVQPVLRLIAPAAGRTLTERDDVRPGAGAEAAGIQVAFEVEVDDPREAADYPVWVECRVDGAGAFQNRFTRLEDVVRRSDLHEDRGTVIVTLAPTDSGRIECRPMAEASPNPPVVEPSRAYIVVRRTGAFDVLSPLPGSCLPGGAFDIAGRLAGFMPELTELEVSIEGRGGINLGPFPLSRQVDGTHRLRIGAQGVAALPDGAYALSVSGTFNGDTPIEIQPREPIEIVVDSLPPSDRLVIPDPDLRLGPADDVDGDPSNCVQTPLVGEVSDSTATEACYSVNGDREHCVHLHDGRYRVDRIDWRHGDNIVQVIVIDCAGRRSVSAHHVEVSCRPPPTARITAPALNGRLGLGADRDRARAGVQIDVDIETNLWAGETVDLLVLGASGGRDRYGPLRIDGRGLTSATVDLVPPADVAEATWRLQVVLSDDPLAVPLVQSDVTLVLLTPELQLDLPEACVGQAAIDESPRPGYQHRFRATTRRVEAGRLVRLQAQCPGFASEAVGAVEADGWVVFAPLDLPEEGDCEIDATTTDLAGQPATDSIPFVVDRRPPVIAFTLPTHGQTLGVADDIDPRDGFEGGGLQIEPRLTVCGGRGSLAVDSDPPLYAESLSLDVDDADCVDVRLPMATLPLSGGDITAEATDACGNTTEARARYAVDLPASASIDAPRPGVISTVHDLAPEAAGCQMLVEARVAHIGGDALIQVCSDAPGEPHDDCAGGSVVSTGSCLFDPVTPGRLTCPVTLTEQPQRLTLVVRSGALVNSPAVAVIADCTAPRVRMSHIVNDANRNGCLDRQEGRARAPDAAATATVAFETEGLEPGRAVTLTSEPRPERRVDPVIVGADGTVRFELTLPPGMHRLHLAGSDVAGNPLAGEVERLLEVDTQAPTPHVIGLADGGCIGVSHRAALGADEFVLAVDPGVAAGESALVEVNVDDTSFELEGRGVIALPPLPLADGEHRLTLTVRDRCGNLGSVAGFEALDGTDDWAHPRSLGFRVDGQAPVVELRPPVGAEPPYRPSLDQGGDPRDGLQLRFEIAFAGGASIEPGQPIEIQLDGAAAEPARITMPDPPHQLLKADVRVYPGVQRLDVQATDACGNIGRASLDAIEVEIAGCTGQVPGDERERWSTRHGIRDGEHLVVTLPGQVDLYDPTCVEATARLEVDGALTGAAQVVEATGQVFFPAVPLRIGEHRLRMRIARGAEVTFTPERIIHVDLTPPTIDLVAPRLDPAATTVLLDDEVPGRGVQRTFTVAVTGAAGGVLTTHLGDDQTQTPIFLDNDEITTAPLDIPASPSPLRICSADAAENETCLTYIITSDGGPPGGIALDIEADKRTGRVELLFDAPGDDGDEGQVSSYRVRVGNGPIEDETDWVRATPLPDQPARVAFGQPVRLSIGEWLALDATHHVAVRAVDDAGLEGPLAGATIDQTWHRQPIPLTPADGGVWPVGGAFVGASDAIVALGDFTDDGHRDYGVAVRVAAGDGTSRGQAAVVDVTAWGASVLPLGPPASEGGNPVRWGAAVAGGDFDGDGRADAAVVGHVGDAPDAPTLVGLYFGHADFEGADAPDVLLWLPGHHTLAVGGAFVAPEIDGPAPDDLVLAGGSEGGASAALVIIAGRERAAWLVAAALDVLPDIVAVEAPRPVGRLKVIPRWPPDAFDVLLIVSQDGAGHFAAGRPQWPHAPAIDDPDIAVPLTSRCEGGVRISQVAIADAALVAYDRARTTLHAFRDGVEAPLGEATCGVLYPLPGGPGLAFDTIGDLDGDGHVDLAVGRAGLDTGRFDLLLGGQPRGFGEPYDRGIRASAWLVREGRVFDVSSAGDVDQDGRGDLLVLHALPEGGVLVTLMW